jgi:hypothetical protein
MYHRFILGSVSSSQPINNKSELDDKDSDWPTDHRNQSIAISKGLTTLASQVPKSQSVENDRSNLKGNTESRVRAFHSRLTQLKR